MWRDRLRKLKEDISTLAIIITARRGWRFIEFAKLDKKIKKQFNLLIKFSRINLVQQGDGPLNRPIPL